MSKKILLSFTLIIVNVHFLLAQHNFQSGFIISLEKDTIRGEIDFRSNRRNYKSCVFRNQQRETEYLAEQILGFGFTEGKFYSSQVIEASFVEVLVLGDISLFRSKDRFHIKKDTSLFDLESIIEVETIDGKEIRVDKGKWKGIISYFISDCLENASTYTDRINLNEKSLTSLVIRYNQCKSGDYLEFKENKPWTQLGFGLLLGLNQSGIKFTEGPGAFIYSDFSYLANNYSSFDPSIGLVVDMSFPRITERLALQAELNYLRSRHSAQVTLQGSRTEYHETFIELNTISIPISLKYSFPFRTYGWFLQVGLNYDNQSMSKTRLLSEEVSGTTITAFPERPAFDINNNQLGYWGGIGLLRAFDKFRVSLDLRYYQMSGLSRTEGVVANNNRFSLNLILSKKP